MADGHETDKNIEIWKIKKLIKALEAARGNGTSMISLIMPPRDQISRVTKMLGDEFGTASNIKSRVNRQSVLGAITSAQQRLKLYNKVPPNGLVLYTGTIVTDDGKEKKVTIDFEPFRPINASLYLCDNKFHIEALNELLESDDKFGFIVMDGNGTLFGTLSGNTREVLHKFSVDLPKKHGRGGQSALRFARLRMEIECYVALDFLVFVQINKFDILRETFECPNRRVLLFAMYVPGRSPRKSKLDRWLMCWWAFTGLTHLILEGYFAFAPEFYKDETAWYPAEVWKEYSKGDSRYAARDAGVVAVEGLTAVIEGPASLLAVYAISKGKSYSYILQFAISLGQLYGTAVYFITAYLDGDKFATSSFYYYAYYIAANASWVVIPTLISIRCWKKISAAVQVQGQGQGQKKNKTR